MDMMEIQRYERVLYSSDRQEASFDGVRVEVRDEVETLGAGETC